MTFKRRYLSEETTPSEQQTRDQAAKDYTNLNDAKPADQKPAGVSDVAVASAVPAVVPLVRSVENINDVQGNRSPNDANAAGENMARESRKAVKGSSRTPFNVVTESTEGRDPMDRFRGPYHNKLRKKLKDAGLNTGADLSTIAPSNPKVLASMTGQKNINSGTNAVINNTKKVAGKHAAANVNIPNKKDIKNATTLTDSSHFSLFDISQKIEMLLETDENKRVSRGYYTQPAPMKGVADASTPSKTNQTHNMVSQMGNITKAKEADNVTRSTMPEKEIVPEHGNMMSKHNIVHGNDDANTAISQQREERLSAEAQAKEQQNG